MASTPATVKNQHVSPLRYPGGKFKLAPIVESIIENNLPCNGSYVEPYAGGAGLALSLLTKGYVRKVYLNDLNYPLYCFWHSLLNEPDELLKKLYNAKISVEAWKRHRNKIKQPNNYSMLDVGFALLFLNRTNRSGIIDGRMIGGYEQNGDWKMDARFYRSTLKKRIEIIQNHKDKISFYNLDAIDFIKKFAKKLSIKKTLVYLDPPYFQKGQRLYDNHYNPIDHFTLSEEIAKLTLPWIISYDNVTEIKKMYKKYEKISYTLNYSAALHTKGKEIMIFSNNLKTSGIGNLFTINRSAN